MRLEPPEVLWRRLRALKRRIAARVSLALLLAAIEQASLDALLQAKEDQFTPGFQSQPMKYNFEVMPEGFGVDEFVKSWNS